MEEIKPSEQLTKKERVELHRKEKERAGELLTKKRYMKRVMKQVTLTVLIVLPLGGLIWYGLTRPTIRESEIISRNGLHWHPELVIYVKGQKQEIPTNIGIGAVHQPIHTHDATGTIHLEFQDMVRKQDIILGQFFKNWGKNIQSFGTNMKMTVNGKESTEYENYVMQDKDKIELQYE
ncbi:MAG: hypothetical protein AAB706_02055 [Patescibacteria group bacterium]